MMPVTLLFSERNLFALLFFCPSQAGGDVTLVFCQKIHFDREASLKGKEDLFDPEDSYLVTSIDLTWSNRPELT